MISKSHKNPQIPTIIVRKGSKRYYCRGVKFLSIKGDQNGLFGPGLVKQLDCGARTYQTMEGEFELIDSCSFKEAKSLCISTDG